MRELHSLIQHLSSGDVSVAASVAESLLHSSISLTGPPPQELLLVITSQDVPQESFVNLARAWSRVEMSHSVIDGLFAAMMPERERFAQLLKSVLAIDHYKQAADIVINIQEDSQVRRWSLEGIERLAFAGLLGWRELEVVVTTLSVTPEPVLRAGLSSLLMLLPWQFSNIQILENFLCDPCPEVVAAAAQTLAGHSDAVKQLNSDVLKQLHQRPEVMIRQSIIALDKSLNQK